MADDINGLLQQLQFAKKTKSEVLMVGLCEEICTILCIGSEDHIRVIDASEFVKILSEILMMQSSLPELKVFAMRAIALILDIVPRSGPATVASDVIPLALNLLSQPDVTIQLAEELIKTIECLSLDFPHLILDKSGLQKLLLWLEGLESAKERLHIRVISIVSNICSRLRHSDWELIKGVFPVLVSILDRSTQRLSDITTAKEAVGAVSGCCLAFAHLVDRLGSEPTIFDSIMESSLLDALVNTIRVTPVTSEATSDVPPKFQLRPCAPTQYSFILRVMSVIYSVNPSKGIEIYQDQRVLELACSVILKNMQTSPDYTSQRGVGDGDDGGQMFMSQIAFNGAAFTSGQSENSGSDKRNNPNQSPEEIPIATALEFLLMLLPSVPNSLLNVEVLIPFHWWTWEDDFRNLSEFEELVCHELESEYARQRKRAQLKAVDIIIHSRNSTIRFNDMRQVSRGTGGTRPIYRDPIPCYFVRCHVSSVSEEVDGESTAVAAREKATHSSSRRASVLLRSNQVHPAPLQSEPSDADVGNATQSSNSDGSSNEERSVHSDHSPSEQVSGDTSSCTSCFEFFKQRFLSCWNGTPEDIDSASSAADRRVIDTTTYYNSDLRSTLLPSTTALDKLILSHIAANPLFLKQLLIHVLPTMIQFLNSSVNANLIKDSVVVISRIISVYGNVVSCDPPASGDDKNDSETIVSEPQLPVEGASTEVVSQLRELLLPYVDGLSAALVLTMSSCVSYTPIVMSDYIKGHLVAPTPGLSVYGTTISAILSCMDIVLNVHGDIFAPHLTRNGIHTVLDQIINLPIVLRSRGQQCCTDCPSGEDQSGHSCGNKRILDKLVTYTKTIQTRLSTFVSSEDLERDLVELHSFLNSGTATSEGIASLLQAITDRNATPFELLHQNCRILGKLTSMLSDPVKRMELAMIVAKGKNPHPAITTLTDITQRCANICLPATGLAHTHQHVLMIGGVDTGRISAASSASQDKAPHISSISLPLKVNYIPAVISAGIMNNIIDRLARPFFLRCVPMAGGCDEKGDPDQVHTISIFPFATFGLLEKYINSKKDDYRSIQQPSRHRSSHSGIDEVRNGNNIPNPIQSAAVSAIPPQLGTSPRVTIDSSVVLSQSGDEVGRDDKAFEYDPVSTSSVIANPGGGSVHPHALSANTNTDASASVQNDDIRGVAFDDGQTATDSNNPDNKTDAYKSTTAEPSTSSAIDIPPRPLSLIQQPGSPLQSAATISSVSSAHGRGQTNTSQKEVPTTMTGPHSPTIQSEAASVRETDVTSVPDTHKPLQIMNSPGVHASCAVSLPCTRTLSPAMDPLIPTSPTPSVVLSQGSTAIPLSTTADRGRGPTAAGVSTSSDVVAEPPTRSVASSLMGSIHASFHPQNATTRSSTAAASNHSDGGGGNQNPLSAVQGQGIVGTTDRIPMNSAATTATTASREDAHTTTTTDGESDKIYSDTELPPSIEFLIDGHVIPCKRLTILDAAILYSTAGLNMRKVLTACSLGNQQKPHLGKSMLNKALALWSGNFVVHYRRQSDPISSVDVSSNDTCASEISEPQWLKSSLEAGTLTASILKEVSDLQEDSATPPPSSKTNLKLASALLSDEHRAANLAINFTSLTPLNQCVGDTRKLVKVIVTNYPLLFPFHLRIQYFDNIVCGARQAVLRNITLPSYVSLGGPHNSGWISTFRTVLGSQWLRLPGIWSRSSLRKQKVVVSRESILHCADVLLSRHATSPLHLDIYFDGEPGTGSGPTTEFFNLVGIELQRANLNLWRGSSDAGGFINHPGGLFPAVANPSSCTAVRNNLSHSFLFVGRVIGRAIREYKVLNVRFHILFYKILLGIDITQNASESLTLLEPEYEQSLKHIEALTAVEVPNGDPHPINSLELETVLPGTESYQVLPADPVLTKSNATAYIASCREILLSRGVAPHFKAILQGIDEVFPATALQVFTPEELQSIVEGRASQRLWPTTDDLSSDIICDHGYTRNSAPITQLIEVVVEMSDEEQRNFLTFISGSPKMPLGGLSPKITVVRRGLEFEALDEELQFTDVPLPSVNTCFHYLKLPAYQSKEILREKLLLAVKDGRGSFDLS
eukprot:TRINITY_DN15236_c1_g1_i2.p1 TRINITY_DN15236_c1_g1~~TRINITY_DN15236_c1_g1_i2.p1  ORF type:complete len:2083 (+),score=363.11 TRINITY_DN15236_c1_g1_i2:112-6360(+)